MSIINQVLLDLDKRRASGAERSALPDHVRALPEVREGTNKWLIAAVSGLAVVAVVAWAMMSGFTTQQVKKTVPAMVEAKPAAGDKIIEAAAKSEAIPDVQPRDESAALPEAVAETLLFGRLSFDLANPPVAMPESAQRRSETRVENRAPIATSRVIAKPRAEPGTPAVPAAAALTTAPAGQSAGTEPAPKAPARNPTKLAQAMPPEIQKNVIKPTALQLAEQEYGQASVLLHQGKRDEARDALMASLKHYPAHMGARQGLFGMMIDAKQYAEAEQIVQEGLKLNPAQTGFAMMLARLQLDRGNTPAAVDTLQKGLVHAQNNPDYLSFLAALLQRQKRHNEAIDQYAAALKLQPQSGVWLMGLGISLQAVNRNPEAQEAFRRAKASGTLTSDLQAYVDQRLRQLQ
ncbi:MAG: tetratricopeptide repeat protein [Burkholderiales bacterium]|nr:tetratricopeptide repeat protein [Burkholderiales bacterium]